MAVTQKQIAQNLGVSQTLVGVALHGNGRISDELRARVLEEARRLGYKTNRLARALKSGRSNLVALALPRPLGAYDAQILETLHRLAARDGFHLLTALCPRFESEDDSNRDNANRDNPNRDTANRDNLSRHLLVDLPLGEWPLDGVLALDSSAQMSRLIGALARQIPALPLVAFGHRDLPHESDFDAVRVDLSAAATGAVEHLLARGCRNLAFVAARSQFEAGEPRLAAFRAVCHGAGLGFETIAVPDSPTLRRETQTLLLQHLQNGARFDGFFCGNDDVALGVLRACQRAGLEVPNRAKIIGCDDIPDALDADPPLSTIAWPLETLCQHAWELLKSRLEAPKDTILAPRREVLSAQFLSREST